MGGAGEAKAEGWKGDGAGVGEEYKDGEDPISTDKALGKRIDGLDDDNLAFKMGEITPLEENAVDWRDEVMAGGGEGYKERAPPPKFLESGAVNPRWEGGANDGVVGDGSHRDWADAPGWDAIDKELDKEVRRPLSRKGEEGTCTPVVVKPRPPPPPWGAPPNMPGRWRDVSHPS